MEEPAKVAGTHTHTHTHTHTPRHTRTHTQTHTHARTPRCPGPSLQVGPSSDDSVSRRVASRRDPHDVVTSHRRVTPAPAQRRDADDDAVFRCPDAESTERLFEMTFRTRSLASTGQSQSGTFGLSLYVLVALWRGHKKFGFFHACFFVYPRDLGSFCPRDLCVDLNQGLTFAPVCRTGLEWFSH